MAKRRGDGHFSQAPKLNKGEGDSLADVPGKDLSKEIFDNNDSAAVRGGRPNRSENGR